MLIGGFMDAYRSGMMKVRISLDRHPELVSG